jgi:hypothetical protein
MKKIKITREQYDNLLLAEQKRLSNSSNDLLTESINNNSELLEEGWKEIVLGIAMLMGLNLTGQNNKTAEKALSDANIIKQIETTLEDKSETEELVNLMKEKGMKDPSLKLAQNADKIINNFNKLSDKEKINAKLSVAIASNLKSLDSKIKQGYALKSADISQDTIKGGQNNKIIIIKDTIDFEFGNMKNLFDTGGYNLTEDGKKAINNAIDSIKTLGGKVLSVEIESSTDAERIESLITKDDPTGNITLANLRSESVNDLVSSLVGDAEITTREIPNNGKDIVSTETFKKVANDVNKTKKLRDETAQFRYVKLNIVAEFTKESEDPEPIPDKIIKNMRFELVKLYEPSSGTVKIGGKKPKFKNSNFKCKRLVDKSGVANCFTF